MRRKVIISVIGVCLILLSFAFAVTPNFKTQLFKDVEQSHWAYNSIVEMKQKGLINGYEDGTFRPDKTVTREEFAQMVYNVEKKTPSFDKYQYYADVEAGRWSYAAIQLVGYSIMDEIGAFSYFYPTDPIQRQEVAKVLSDYYSMTSNFSNKEYYLSKLNIADKNQIYQRYIEAVYHMYTSGLMNGLSETEFGPDKFLTRAQAATLLLRITKMPKPTPEPIITLTPTAVSTPLVTISIITTSAPIPTVTNMPVVTNIPITSKPTIQPTIKPTNTFTVPVATPISIRTSAPTSAPVSPVSVTTAPIPITTATVTMKPTDTPKPTTNTENMVSVNPPTKYLIICDTLAVRQKPSDSEEPIGYLHGNNDSEKVVTVISWSDNFAGIEYMYRGSKITGYVHNKYLAKILDSTPVTTPRNTSLPGTTPRVTGDGGTLTCTSSVNLSPGRYTTHWEVYYNGKSISKSLCTYNSSNTKIATRDGDKIVAGQTMGTAIISISYAGRTTTIKVNVGAFTSSSTPTPNTVFTKAGNNEYAVITCDTLGVRRNPDDNEEPIGYLHGKNTNENVVKLIEYNDYFTGIEYKYNGQIIEGYVHSKYLARTIQ